MSERQPVWRLQVYSRAFGRWDVVAEYTSGFEEAQAMARAYRTVHPTRRLRLQRPGGSVVTWPDDE
jgi:hypothetical protein